MCLVRAFAWHYHLDAEFPVLCGDFRLKGRNGQTGEIFIYEIFYLCDAVEMCCFVVVHRHKRGSSNDGSSWPNHSFP